MTSQYLDKLGTSQLTKKIVDYIGDEVIRKIKPAITEAYANGDPQNIASVKAVYDAIEELYDAMAKLKLVPTDPDNPGEPITIDPGTGKPNLQNPIEGVIYLVKVGPDRYEQWVLFDGEWFNLGTTEADLSGFWKIEDLQPMSSDDIDAIWDSL